MVVSQVLERALWPTHSCFFLEIRALIILLVTTPQLSRLAISHKQTLVFRSVWTGTAAAPEL